MIGIVGIGFTGKVDVMVGTVGMGFADSVVDLISVA